MTNLRTVPVNRVRFLFHLAFLFSVCNSYLDSFYSEHINKLLDMRIRLSGCVQCTFDTKYVNLKDKCYFVYTIIH